MLLYGVNVSGQTTAGIYEATGVQSDLAIHGPGYFVLRDHASGVQVVTRQGDFSIDTQGYFVNSFGMRLQGFSDPSLTLGGDLKISGSATASMATYGIQTNGMVNVGLSDGSQLVCGQVLLQNFTSPASLGKFPYGMSLLNQAAGPLPQLAPPGTSGVGSVAAGQIEIPVPKLTLLPASNSAPNLAQGILTPTGIQTDLAIEGRGFFVVRDMNSNAFYATRAGACYLDGDGYLVNYAGMRVQGYNDSNLSTNGDIAINIEGATGFYPGLQMTWFSVDWTGTISVLASDGSSFVRGQILLDDCAHPELLLRTNFSLYPMTSAAGPWTVVIVGNIPTNAQIISGSLEVSQLDQSILNVRKTLNFFPFGPISTSTNQDNLAINGNGFFTLRDPIHNTFYASQYGNFHLDSAAWLVDSNGFRVQGFSDGGLSATGDIRIDTNGAPLAAAPFATISSHTIGNDGTITVNLSDGTTFVRGQILLQNFRALQALVPVNGLLYSNLAAALPMYPVGTPGSGGLGVIMMSYLNTPNPPATLQLPPQAGFHLVISDLLVSATVQASSDLLHWADVGQLENSVMQDAEFYDTNSLSVPAKFYRVRSDWGF